MMLFAAAVVIQPGLAVKTSAGEHIWIADATYPNSLTVLKSYYTHSALINTAQKNQPLTPIIIRKHAHNLFIKSPTTIENVVANTTGIPIPGQRFSKYIKGVACKYTHTHGRFIRDSWAAIHSRQACNISRTAHTKYVQNNVLI
jgi:hypothetical protein